MTHPPPLLPPSVHFLFDTLRDSCAVYLLSYGANPYITDKDGDTALVYAEQENLDRHLQDMLFSNESCRETYDFFWDTVKRIGWQQCIRQQSNGTPMIVALAKDELAHELLLLLHKGGDPNTVNHAGASALNFACKYQHLDCVNLLLEYGANVNAISKGGRTPLMMAIKYDATGDIVHTLMKHGADPDIVSPYDGWTAWNFLSPMGNVHQREFFRKLLKNGDLS